MGRILHFGCDIFGRAPEKVLALRARDIEAAPDVARTLTGAIAKAARYRGRQEIAAMLARPDRVSVDARLIQRTLVGELKIAVNETRANPNYLILGEGGALRPDAVHAIWLYAQLLRWGQADSSMERAEEATRVFRADLFDAAIGDDAPGAAAIGDPVGAFDASPPVESAESFSVSPINAHRDGTVPLV